MGQTMAKEQLKIGLDPKMRQRLEDAAKKAGVSLGEEVRQRLERSFDRDDTDPVTRDLQDYVALLATMIRLQTNHIDWFKHPAAHRAFQFGITSRLARLKPEGEPVFGPDDLPKHWARLVSSDNPEAIGQGLESIEHSNPPISPEKLRILQERSLRNLIEWERSKS